MAMTLSDLNKPGKSVSFDGRDPESLMHVEHYDGPPLTEEAQFDAILEMIGYDPDVSVDIRDPDERRRFFEYWARKKRSRRREALYGSEA